MAEAKDKVQLHLQKIQQEIFAIERHIDLIRKAIQDKTNPLKVAHTRLEARSHRPGLEMCKLVRHKLVFEENVLRELFAGIPLNCGWYWK